MKQERIVDILEMEMIYFEFSEFVTQFLFRKVRLPRFLGLPASSASLTAAARARGDPALSLPHLAF